MEAPMDILREIVGLVSPESSGAVVQVLPFMPLKVVNFTPSMLLLIPGTGLQFLSVFSFPQEPESPFFSHAQKVPSMLWPFLLISNPRQNILFFSVGFFPILK